MPCSICKKTGHNKKTCTFLINNNKNVDRTEDILEDKLQDSSEDTSKDKILQIISNTCWMYSNFIRITYCNLLIYNLSKFAVPTAVLT